MIAAIKPRGPLKLVVVAGVCVLGLVTAPATWGAFGIAGFDVQTQAGSLGGHYAQAGGHPYSIRTSIEWNNHPDPGLADHLTPDGSFKDVHVDTPPGVTGSVTSLPRCTSQELLSLKCSVDSQVGIVRVVDETFGGPTGDNGLKAPLFNMPAPSGLPARFGFQVFGVQLSLDVTVRSEGDYGLTIGPRNTPQALNIFKTIVTFWGVPADESHDAERGFEFEGMPSQAQPTAFLTNATSCTAPGEGKPWTLHTNSWQDPGTFFESTIFSHEDPGFPVSPANWGAQRGVENCDIVPFTPTISVKPTTKQAESPTGLNVSIDVPTEGFNNPYGIAQANLKKAVVRLPEGMSINPSAGAGLGTCSPAQFASETAVSEFGDGCPAQSKIGTVRIETPAISEPLEGSLFIATQDDPTTAIKGLENPFDSLLAMYIVLKNPDRGLVVKFAGQVAPDPDTGQLVTTFDDNPQLPFSNFTLSFREGQRSPLVSPPTCGTFTAEAEMTPWSNPGKAITLDSSFGITEGVGGGSCSSDTAHRPFNPGLQAGTLNNNAGSYSPVNIRMTRNDGEQEITSFSADLPPGLVGKLAGVPYCPDAAIEAAKHKTGTEENNNPSCPAASQVGRTLAGAGVGSVLAYAPGKVYLAGPYKGHPLSVAAITSATVGPFDLGTVVIRSAFKIDPETAKVSVDSAGSDPIPHILEGIPLHIRDIRIYVDKPDFTLNPTNCDRFNFATRLTGSGADFVNPADDIAANISNPFQVANCANLGFKPKLSLKLKGGTHRGDFPTLSATLLARPGDANIASTTVTLPKTEFIEQGHIRTVCTRVQFAAKQCPAGSVYGHAKAVTPLFDQPLEGPVYLRSNGGSRLLPDLVASLSNDRIEVNLAGFIDSVKGGIRNTFAAIPDAPVTKFTLNMQGGKKSLLVNHVNLCKARARAKVQMVGQNGKVYEPRVLMRNSCKKGRRR